VSSNPTTRPLGRPREARADEAIVVATLELIAEHGVHALRMDDVADRARVGKATIYRRYGSKGELVTAAVGGLVNEIEVPDSGCTRTDLLALMLAAVALYSAPLAARLLPTVIDEMSRNAEFAAVVQSRFMTARRGALRAVFERGVRRGDLRRDVDIELALDILAGPLFYRLLITGGPIDERLAENTVELILRGFGPESPRDAKPARSRERPR